MSNKGDKGMRGMIAFCPVCGSSCEKITWDPKTDTCTCACGWSNDLDRKKQIEEMAKEICENCRSDNDGRKSEWISVKERVPTVEEEERGLVGIVNGHNGKIRFTDAIIFVNYDFDEKEWWSQDYDLTDCKVAHWMPLPEAPKMKGGGEG